MPANYLHPAGEPVAPPIVNDTVNKTVNKTVNVFQPKPEHDWIDIAGRLADTIRKGYDAFRDLNPFSHLIPFLPIGGMGQNNQVQENFLSHSLSHYLCLKFQLSQYK